MTQSKTIQHWIDNKVLAGASSATAPVTNPATGEVTGQVALASVEDARAVIDRSRRISRMARHLARQKDSSAVPIQGAAQRAQR